MWGREGVVCVCVYVCTWWVGGCVVSLRMCLRVCLHMRVCAYVCVCAHVHAYLCAHTCPHACVHMCVCVRKLLIYTQLHLTSPTHNCISYTQLVVLLRLQSAS